MGGKPLTGEALERDRARRLVLPVAGSGRPEDGGGVGDGATAANASAGPPSGTATVVGRALGATARGHPRLAPSAAPPPRSTRARSSAARERVEIGCTRSPARSRTHVRTCADPCAADPRSITPDADGTTCSHQRRVPGRRVRPSAGDFVEGSARPAGAHLPPTLLAQGRKQCPIDAQLTYLSCLSKPSESLFCRSFLGAPDRIRTCDLRFRRPTLYPAELRALGDERLAAPGGPTRPAHGLDFKRG